jgi:23S rRNA (guanosine2251-2'-O)-methyltransferase
MPWTYGIHPVESLLEADADGVLEIWMVESRRPGPARERLREQIEKLGVRIRMVTDEQLRTAVGDGNHQGIAARTGEYEYADETSLLAESGPGLIVVLDEVQDPHNLGAVLRTARAFGVRGVVIPKHRAASVTAAVRKVAAGAASSIAVARVVNVARFLEDARDAGYWAYGAVATGGQRPTTAKLDGRCVLVLGSEQKGIRANVLERCDVQVTLPIEGVESLNVSVAAGVLIYEWARQAGRA